ncbi:glycosyltransferase family 4 protein [Solihabitans fulvus]|uniref:Glycosyltransferase family 4 protein n=1 Tax=Solihabitans fulvus TaxID=1892852 RepID=A0A5B2WMS1_9PSEU|nr:glycosyltransferase family 4 protein [Solihabitans fulvus]KAA2253333.1 glycosyltransferase family 4 protein [Solihabitans fulvus]
MRVGVCDFPSSYAFPPYGYGGIERWLWAAATGARQAGAEVHLLGPAWRDDLPSGLGRLPVRLEDLRPGDRAMKELTRLQLDLLIVGHEYPSLPAWRRTHAELDCDVATFQHDPHFQHAPDAFDGHRTRLYCYSPEMMDRYRDHRPHQDLSVQFGLHEEGAPAVLPGEDLVWIGRIDQDKAPHLAALAAAKVGRRLRVIGPVLDRDYLAQHEAILGAAHVDLVGELSGAAKLDALRGARAMVYTCARDYVEAGAAVFGETLRCGTPVAALTWRQGTCAQAALDADIGSVARVDPRADDETAATALAEAITVAERLDPGLVQQIGLEKFSPRRHFLALVSRP